MTDHSNGNHHINPRVRAFGKARLDIARRAQTRQDWDALWKKPQHEFPFAWGAFWKQCVEYRVADYAAEVGFYIDILGLPVNAFNEYTAMFTGPDHEFYFAVTPTFEGQQPTPPDALRLQFFVRDIFDVAEELEHRGIAFEQPPQPVSEGSNYFVGYFRTPHGICIDLCGLYEEAQVPAEESQEDAPETPEIEEIAEPEPFPLEVEHIYAASNQDQDDVFEEVQDEPKPSAPQPGLFRPSPNPTLSRPANQSQSQQAGRFQPPAVHQPSPPASAEPTYEPVDDSAPGQAPSRPPVQPRTYRAISFNEEHR
jgi:catechol 2,3-dioxygenase-like lactoylglutathione lyase family enzyme